MNKFQLTLTLILGVLFIAACSSSLGSSEDDTEATSGDSGSSDSSEDAANSFPEESIELVVPFSAGGGGDTAGRIIAEAASKHLPGDESIVVVNSPGGGGVVGLTEVFNSKSDGYTIGFATRGPLVAEPLVQDTSYSADDFEPIIRIINNQQMFLARADAPYSNVEEWLEYVKENPGEFKYGISGQNTEGNLVMQELKKEENLDIISVPFEGGGPAVTALKGGEIDGASVFPGTSGDDEELQIIFNPSSERSDIYEDVPTLKEKGYDIVKESYNGIIAPEGISEDKQEILHDAFHQALENPKVQEMLESSNQDVSYGDGEEFQEQIEQDMEDDKETLQDMGLIE
ncbi:tripartite tricarboxylate transporter substrate binding protein [Salibacterium aidingense]|uniref:tripartite tricarboxylate transporter substrate binding protein n=1 Tax=Salibacterium aidingense TaxID=384933 RepID=UPI003BDF6145